MEEKLHMRKQVISKENYIKIIWLAMLTIFAIPSIIYLIKNKTVYKFYYVWTYLFKMPANSTEKLLNAGIFFALFTTIFLIYFFIIKQHKKIFKNKKQIFTLILISSILFMLIIPYTSTDVYSYIANGWSASHYNENPYYVSTGEIADQQQVNDQMFNKVARCWKYETVVYGPLWTLICTILTSFSFGNINFALLIFKIVSLLVHILNCVLVYKITKKNLFVLIYGLNPFVLFEALTNVHNDIFIVLFILLAIYFTVRKKNLFLSVGFVALATAIKYFAILLLPFLVLYAVRKKTIPQRIKYCILCGIEYIAIIALFYLIYLKDLNVLAGLFIQQNKYNRGIFYILYYFLGDETNYLSIIKNGALLVFAVYYVYVVIKLLTTKQIIFSTAIRKYNIIIAIFTFILITNFNSWYVLWLFPTMFFLKGKHIKTIISLSYASQIGYLPYFALWSEDAILGIPYFIMMVVLTILLSKMDYKNNKEKV